MILRIAQPIGLFFTLVIMAALLPTAPALAANGKEARQSTDPERSRIEQIIRNYLLENPELLIEVMRKLEARQKAAEEAGLIGKIKANRKALFASADDFIVNPAGKIPVVEFFDYQCGYCKRFAPNVTRLLKTDKTVRFVFKEFPILGELSVVASRAALAAKMQGKYQAFHDAMMKLRRRLTEALIYQTATDVGLDIARLKTDMARPKISLIIEANRQLADALGIRGTPSIVIGEQLAPGAISYEQLTGMINQARANCSVC
ncbi:MAG: DsbA family protein [Alphaproteobacteria bacterium]|jgi:protein-disulfide isomerase|nr:DsbA family protein [Alphaproteobacteria bacterium]|tara:strand:- start:397 stop:1179 length:783 start_codon:yes stop_codon:yes gene_type:complete